MKDIQQSSNISTSSFISIFYRIGVSYLSKRYETYQIGYGQYQYLLTLYYEDGLSQDELTKRIAVDKATTTRAINRLKNLDYVTTTIDSVDKRIHHVWLTQKSRDLQEQILDISTDWENLLLNSLTEDEKRYMSDIFYKIAASNDWLPAITRKLYTQDNS